jgi:hypothetical protein
VGMDMPGVFLKISYSQDKTNETLDKINEGMQRYFKKKDNR